MLAGGREPRALRKGDPGWGPTCACGRPKSKQGRKCQACRTSEKRGPAWVRRQYASVRFTAATIDEQIARARESLTGELRRLADEQARDDRCRRIESGHLSLDVDIGDGRTRHEVIAA